MKSRIFDTSGTPGLTLLPEAATPLKNPGSCTWIDCEDYTDVELAGDLKALGFSERSVRTCLEARGRAWVRAVQDEVFFELPIHTSNAGGEEVALGFLCRPDTVVTIHRQPIVELDAIAVELARDADTVPASTSFLVASLLEALSTQTVDAADDIRRMTLAMQTRMDSDPDGVEIAEIQEQSQATRNLDAVVGERMVVLERLHLIESPALDLAEMADFRAAEAETHYADRTADRLEKTLTDLRIRVAANQQARTNRRLGILTVLSAVFLPLTLLSGIYGMNFEYMPELGFRYAYPIVLGAMAALALGLVAFFHSRGWFD